MADRQEKNLENHLRREANKQGYGIKKARGALSVNNEGGYMIFDIQTSRIEAGEKFNLSLEDIEKFLAE